MRGPRERLSVKNYKAGGGTNAGDYEGVSEVRRALRERSVLQAQWGKFSRGKRCQFCPLLLKTWQYEDGPTGVPMRRPLMLLTKAGLMNEWW